MKKKRVLIAGGGIGGMTLALALKRAGLSFLVLEQASGFRRVGGGIGLWGPALKAYKQLGVEEKLSGRLMTCAGYRKHSQVARGEWLVRPSEHSSRHTSCLCLHRGDLQEVLFQQLDSTEIMFNARVVSYFEQQENREGGVKVELHDGRILSGSVLIGADGVDSTIRRIMFPAINANPCGYYYWQGVGSSDNVMGMEHSLNMSDIPAFEAWGPRMRFGMVPLQGPHNFWFMCSDQKIAQDDLVKSADMFSSAISKLVDQTPKENMFEAELKEVMFPYSQDWGVGRVALLGDAAHAMAPNLAQGACLAIEDAFEIAHQLHDMNSMDKGDVERSMSAYFSSRKRRTRFVQFLVPLVHKIGSMHSGLLISMRDGVFNFFPASLKSKVFDVTHRLALGWHYTPPNLGQGLYHRLLDHEFMIRNQSLFEFHKGDVNRWCSGSAEVTRGQSLISRFICNVLQIPKDMKNGMVELEVQSNSDGSEVWRRLFLSSDGIHCEFNTAQNIFEENLIETFGPLLFDFRVAISGSNEFTLDLHKLRIGFSRILSIPMPSIFCPQVRGTTLHDASQVGWKYHVETRSPLWCDAFIGLIFKYEGHITSFRCGEGSV